jgi:glutamate formiminotransferase/formiminotetrahydrofolate cyclodeaminase
MTYQIVECIPNFSEGRRPEVIASIEEAISMVEGVSLLDQHSDEDHNRTVFTFSGSPDAVLAAAYASIEMAAKLINLDEHEGEHPRIGAADVVPFVPISGVSMEECVSLAESLGQRVGDELGIPVFLYEAAATRPERMNLENIRRGEYEGLKESILSDPAKEPDFGPKVLGPAGATVIGARPPLIAFNVYLNTEDVSIAKTIAKAIRQSSGGLPFVKGLGLLVDGRAQVSMNLTNFRQTSLATVVEEIKKEADELGTEIHSSELVGLIPQEALFDSAQHYLKMDRFDYDQVLETRRYVAEQEKKTVSASFLDLLAAGTATPGGGSAAAYSGAMGASLVAMVAKLSTGKEKYLPIEKRMKEIIDEAENLRVGLAKAVEEDADAFNGVMHAYRLSKETEEERAVRLRAIEVAIQKAADVPMQVGTMAIKVMELANEVAQVGNVNAISDAGSAGVMAFAAVQSASMNVRINALSTADRKLADGWINQIVQIEGNADRLNQMIQSVIKERGGI